MIKKKLYLVGASSAIREMESYFDKMKDAHSEWDIQGFLHVYMPEGKLPLEGYPHDYPLLGTIDSVKLTKDDYCLLAITNREIKKRVFEKLREITNIVTYVNPTSFVGKFCSIGEGSIITSDTYLITNVHIGKMVFINGGCRMADITIGDYSTIFSQVQIGAQTRIGENVMIGSCSTLLPGVQVGDNATIGTGSVVIRNVKPGVTVFGNPAKTIYMSE